MTKVIYSISTKQVLKYPAIDQETDIRGLDADLVILDVIDDDEIGEPSAEILAQTSTPIKDYVADLEALQYRKEWIVPTYTILPKPRWTEFSLALMADAVFVEASVAVNGINPMLVSALVERFSRLEKDGAVKTQFKLYWDAFCSQVLNIVTEPVKNGWKTMALSYDLPSSFVELI